jgi:hypothetical protein
MWYGTLSADKRVSIIVAQYIWNNRNLNHDEELGGLRALDFLYGFNKPIEMNETEYYPLSYRGDKIADSRVEAWEFIVGGGAGFNQLNGLYTPANPTGRNAENEQLWRGLRNLQTFMQSFDYSHMHPDPGIFVSAAPAGEYRRALVNPGKQYAFYAHHSGDRSRGSYQVSPGEYQERWSLALAPGSYVAEWVDPALGTVVESHEIEAANCPYELTTPRFSVDVALRVFWRKPAGAKRRAEPKLKPADDE